MRGGGEDDGADENGKPTTLWMFDASDREAKKTK